LFWIDAADSQPCQGTAGAIQWSVEATGKLFHSGLPHKGINAIEFGTDALNYIQQKFYEAFPQHEREIVYKYTTSSTLKCTQISCAPGSLNQICASCTVQGDIRLTPFYEVNAAKKLVEDTVAAINADPNIVLQSCRGPFSKYTLPAEGLKGAIKFRWVTEGENGVACNLTSPGFDALVEATRFVTGNVEPYSINGSLPLIRELQDKGFDVQISGYGFSSHYHANNECVSLKSMETASQIFTKIVQLLEAKLIA